MSSRVLLRAKLSRHHLRDGATSGVTVEQNSIDHLDDWHLYVQFRGKLARAFRRHHAFSHRLLAGERLAQRGAAANLLANGTVATKGARARQHEIAQAR